MDRKRGSVVDVEELKGYLREAEHHHVERSDLLPMHHWSDWYAGYVDGR